MDKSSQSSITQEVRNRPYHYNTKNTHHCRAFVAKTISESATCADDTTDDPANYPTNYS